MKCLFCQSINTQANKNNRAIIPNDIEADPDDTQSMIRIPIFLQH
jgi:hypothetical protein